jgi:hypothetical protein
MGIDSKGGTDSYRLPPDYNNGFRHVALRRIRMWSTKGPTTAVTTMTYPR